MSGVWWGCGFNVFAIIYLIYLFKVNLSRDLYAVLILGGFLLNISINVIFMFLAIYTSPDPSISCPNIGKYLNVKN